MDWGRADMYYHRSKAGGGHWEILSGNVPEAWTISYNELKFHIRPTGFKHMGLFPEQAANWAYMSGLVRKRVSEGRPVKVLNLFGYTGGASVVCAGAGAHVTHVDAAKGMTLWARENCALSGLPETAFRFIVEDVMSFIRREMRRGRRYEGILMDPPSYGRGPGGEVWKLQDELYALVSACIQILSEEGLFLVINGYTTGFQASVLYNIINKSLVNARGGIADARELCLPVTTGGVLPCGTTGRWQAHET
jgi:23S rRNA (cytosine1962-C5)-methyltransferase